MPPSIPLIAFVNSKSGGQQGIKLQEKLKKYVKVDHIFELSQGGPAPGLLKFKGSKFRILVCGGDGTAGWVLSEIEKLNFPADLLPPIAILPIGTGNDLARTLKWGGGYTGRGLGEAVQQVDKACVVFMDKWKVTCGATKGGADGAGGGEDAPQTIYMNNYLSVGSDADVALKFHELRRAHPEKFTSRTQNKAWYVRLALANMNPQPLLGQVTLEIDGKEIEIGDKTRCLLVLNLPSYSGGGNPWGAHKAKNERRGFVAPAIDDGLLEVVGISGPMQIAAIHAKVSRGKKLGQGKDIKITLSKAIPTQVDGEPWNQPPSVITVQYYGKSLMLANSPPTHPLLPLPLSPSPSAPSPSHASLSSSSSSSSPSGSRELQRTRSSSLPTVASSAPSSPAFSGASAPSSPAISGASTPSSPSLHYGPVPPEKRRKGRLYCDGCGLEFFLPHMLANHAASGLCCGAASSSGSKKDDSFLRSVSTPLTLSDKQEDWKTHSVGEFRNSRRGMDVQIKEDEEGLEKNSSSSSEEEEEEEDDGAGEERGEGEERENPPPIYVPEPIEIEA